MITTAQPGYKFRRIHDLQEMGNEIVLGIDYSTGIAREDFPEYYEEIAENIWHHEDCQFRIVSPTAIVTVYPTLLFDLAVVRKLQMEEVGETVQIYCNWIEPEHQALIDGSQGAIYIETKP